MKMKLCGCCGGVDCPATITRLCKFEKLSGSGEAWTLVEADGGARHEYTVPASPAAGDITLSMQPIRCTPGTSVADPFGEEPAAYAWGLHDRFRHFLPLGTPFPADPGEVWDITRNFVYTDAMAVGSHITPAVVESIEVSFGNNSDFGTDIQIENSSRATVTQIQPVINGVAAGPVQSVSYALSQSNDDTIVLPLDDDTTIQPGDVVAFDLWIDIRYRWNNTTPTLAFAMFFHAFRYVAGDAKGSYRPGRHTYELDFGGTDHWTPDGNAVWKMEPGGNWNVSYSACGIQATPLSTTGMQEPVTGVDETWRRIHLSWHGERPVLSFGLCAPRGNWQTFPPDIIFVMYQPRDDSTYQELPTTHYLETTPQAGLWNRDGATVFDLFAVRYKQSSSTVTTYNNDSGIADIATSITVTRVDQ